MLTSGKWSRLFFVSVFFMKTNVPDWLQCKSVQLSFLKLLIASNFKWKLKCEALLSHTEHIIWIFYSYSASSNVACGVSQHFTSNYQLLEQFADFKLQSGRLSAEKLLWLLGYIVTLCCAWNKNLIFISDAKYGSEYY